MLKEKMFGGNWWLSPEKETETTKVVGYGVGLGFTGEVQNSSTIHADCDRVEVAAVNGKEDVERLEIGRWEFEWKKLGEQGPQNGSVNGIKLGMGLYKMRGQKPKDNAQNKVGCLVGGKSKGNELKIGWKDRRKVETSWIGDEIRTIHNSSMRRETCGFDQGKGYEARNSVDQVTGLRWINIRRLAGENKEDIQRRLQKKVNGKEVVQEKEGNKEIQRKDGRRDSCSTQPYDCKK
ncbi:hypothetical protein VNO78_18111 [Psophocarpus tetragonolobus]|uniref:Uncharacterized protein n=1 Tax=Psophocarpus tetragonolobus TaxID=3891 RepID=A0AAN9SHS1_PSOTE